MLIVVQHSKKGTNREKTQEELTIVDNNWLLVIIAQFIERFIHALLGALKNTHTHTQAHTRTSCCDGILGGRETETKLELVNPAEKLPA